VIWRVPWIVEKINKMFPGLILVLAYHPKMRHCKVRMLKLQKVTVIMAGSIINANSRYWQGIV